MHKQQRAPVVGSTTQAQVVFVGPMGVGKTTAVRTLSDSEVVATEVFQSALALQAGDLPEKRTTTVGIDYGEWTTPEGRKVGLYGTPGQVRFDSARRSVTTQRSRIVLWVFGNRFDVGTQISTWLESLGDETVWNRCLVAVTRLETMVPVPSQAMLSNMLEHIRQGLDPRFHHLPLYFADPRIREDVSRLTLTALELPQDTHHGS